MAAATDRKQTPPDQDDDETPDGVGIGRAREIFGELVSRASYGGERIIIVKHGKRAAALIGLKDLERLAALGPVAVANEA
jgi:prevent-host-death family protein